MVDKKLTFFLVVILFIAGVIVFALQRDGPTKVLSPGEVDPKTGCVVLNSGSQSSCD